MVDKIYIGADHAGFKLKEKLKRWFKKKGIECIDIGNHVLDPTDDYPDYAVPLARKVAATKSFGILVCGSAQGVCIAANKIKGVRAVIPFSMKEVKLSREHNDANIICLSGWFQGFWKAKRMIKTFLETPFSKERRHVRRVNKIKQLDK